MLQNRTQPQFETLETRRLMTATTINGTLGDDVIHVNLVNAGDTLTIDGKGGSDVVFIGDANHTAQNILGDIVIKNPTGEISVAVDDQKNTLYRHAYLGATEITGLAPGKISYDSGATLTVTGGSNNNTYTVGSTGADLYIVGGVGDDEYEISQHHSSLPLNVHDTGGNNEYLIGNATGNLDDVTGPISIGDNGNANVAVYDTQAATGHTYWLNKTSAPGPVGAKLSRSGSAAGMEFDYVGRVQLFTSAHDDIVYLGGASVKFPQFEVVTGDGNDTVFADNYAAESLMGGNGTDTVTVDYLDAASGFETVKASPTGGSIYGNVFADKNGNGVHDVGENGVPSVQVYLDADNDKVWDSNEAGAYTDSNGNWSFLGVPTGKEFIARMYLTNSGLAQTTPSNGTGIHVTLSPGQVVTNKQFGVKEVSAGGASISGTVFNDVDGDGTKDAGESVLQGRTVYIDLDNDKVLDGNEKSTTTNASGFFALSGLAAGTYKVREVLPAGWTQTTPANGYGINVTLSTNQSVGGKFFGCRQTAVGASIAGTIFNDLDGDGTKDGGETGLAGRTLWLDLDNDKVIDANEATTVTDANGNYKFSGLAAGTYKVRQVLPVGWKQTTPSNGYGINVTLATNQSVTGKLFGEQKI
jgi:hypothetical protein